jgi:hypothetical protein
LSAYPAQILEVLIILQVSNGAAFDLAVDDGSPGDEAIADGIFFSIKVPVV